MRVTILEIIESTATGAVVEFSTPYGTGSSLFIGPDLQKNKTYEVGVNIDDDFFWGENITPSVRTSPSIEFHSKNLHITAELIASEDDGCGVLKIGDSIILISTDQKQHTLPMFVNIIAKETSLYPTNI